MPLTIKKPTRNDFWPLLEKLEKRLEGWQAKLISRGGRLQLVNTVLSSIPIYHMISFALPKWVINRIDQIRRKFLWGKAEGQGNGIPLINWSTVCIPKRWGGMGVANLELRNLSLLLRWWWKPYTQRDSLWTMVITRLRRMENTTGPSVWLVRGSFFWQYLIRIKCIFHWSARWSIGDGKSISFWYDNWSGKPIRSVKDGFPRPLLQTFSLREALPLLSDIAPGMHIDMSVVFSLQDDQLLWRWTSTGTYSANSIYNIMVTSGKVKWRYNFIWECSAPVKAKIFGFLVIKERILTHDVMAKRGMTCDMQCYLCDQCDCEEAVHLLFNCSYAKRVWRTMDALLGSRLMMTGNSMQQIWDNSWRSVCNMGSMTQKDWATRFLCTIWFLWRKRNENIFRGKEITVELLSTRIKEEGDLWIKYCKGNGKFDVH